MFFTSVSFAPPSASSCVGAPAAFSVLSPTPFCCAELVVLSIDAVVSAVSSYAASLSGISAASSATALSGISIASSAAALSGISTASAAAAAVSSALSIFASCGYAVSFIDVWSFIFAICVLRTAEMPMIRIKMAAAAGIILFITEYIFLFVVFSAVLSDIFLSFALSDKFISAVSLAIFSVFSAFSSVSSFCACTGDSEISLSSSCDSIRFQRSGVSSFMYFLYSSSKSRIKSTPP